MWKQKYPAGSSAAEITRYRTGNTHNTLQMPCQICLCFLGSESGSYLEPSLNYKLSTKAVKIINKNMDLNGFGSRLNFFL